MKLTQSTLIFHSLTLKVPAVGKQDVNGINVIHCAGVYKTKIDVMCNKLAANYYTYL